MENIDALSPWAEVDYGNVKGLSPRLDTLNCKTVGMFSHFKGHSPYILRAVEEELAKRYPDARFTYFQYPKDTREIEDDPDFLPVFKEWLKGVDGVIAAYGDAGSCAMYHAYNTSLVEKLGIPAVLMCKADILTSASRGAAARFVPNLRIVKVDPALPDLSFVKEINQHVIEDIIKPNVHNVIDDIVAGLLSPLTEKEQEPPKSIANHYASEVFSGTADDINDQFYRHGFTTGLPIVPPTEEAVAEMLRGTDLPRDYVVAKLPPMLGKATVEKIAINAVMAGCLPTYMPVLIAAVKAMADPVIRLVGWTCSVAGFSPNLVLNGKVARDINVNATTAVLSPYFKANASIGRALSYIIMNVSGARPGLEDNAYMGHEGRFFSVYREDEEHSPWEPLQTEYGYTADDSTVTLFWSHERAMFKGGGDVAKLLSNMCQYDNPGGFDPGITFVMSAGSAKLCADAGMSRSDVRNYICEYARKPSSTINARWMRDNNHMPSADIQLPQPGDYSARKYWSTEHINVIVAGHSAVDRGIAMAGGGDHGGPACVKIEVPSNWDELVAEYAGKQANPDYINY